MFSAFFISTKLEFCTRWSRVLMNSCLLLLLCCYIGTRPGARSQECSQQKGISLQHALTTGNYKNNIQNLVLFSNIFPLLWILLRCVYSTRNRKYNSSVWSFQGVENVYICFHAFINPVPSYFFRSRNFPQGTISDMVTDASQGISFVCNNISAFAGDPSRCSHKLTVFDFYLPFDLPIWSLSRVLNCNFCRIYLMGQSAGAHIAACALLEQATKESKGESISWRVSQIKAYFGLSGGYYLFPTF